MSDRRDTDIHRLVMDWPDDAVAEIEGLRATLRPADSAAGFRIVENPTMKPGTMQFRPADSAPGEKP